MTLTARIVPSLSGKAGIEIGGTCSPSLPYEREREREREGSGDMCRSLGTFIALSGKAEHLPNDDTNYTLIPGVAEYNVANSRLFQYLQSVRNSATPEGAVIVAPCNIHLLSPDVNPCPVTLSFLVHPLRYLGRQARRPDLQGDTKGDRT